MVRDTRNSRDGDDDDGLASGLPLLPPASGLIELAVLTAIIVLVDRVLPDVELSDIQPNPFWLPVLLLSLQYGTVSGLIAAGVALLVTVLSGLPPEGVGENHFNYALRVYTQPILWFAAAVILGQFRMRQIAAKEGLRRQVEELTKSRATLADYSTRLRARCDRLEREQAGAGLAPGQTLLERLAQVSGQDGEASEALQRVVDSALPGARVSVYAVKESRLVRMFGCGAGADMGSREIGIAHPLYRAVVSEGASLSVLRMGDEHRLAGEGLAAVPVRAGSAVIGMVKLEHADPADLTEGTPNALAAIALSVAPRLLGGPPAADAVVAESEAVDAAQGRLLRPLRWLPRRDAPPADEPVPAGKPKAVR